MNNHYLIIIHKPSSIDAIVEQFKALRLKESTEGSTQKLILFFFSEAVRLLCDEAWQNTNNELQRILQDSSWDIEFRVCQTSLSRRYAHDSTLMNAFDNANASVSSLAQLADLCLRANAWFFQDNISLPNALNADDNRVLMVLKELPKELHSSRVLLCDESFTEFLDLAMTFASFDIPTTLVFQSDASILWRCDDKSLFEAASENTLASWKKQCLSLKSVYDVDTIVVVKDKDDLKESTEYLSDVDDVIEDVHQWLNNSKIAPHHRLFWHLQN